MVWICSYIYNLIWKIFIFYLRLTSKISTLLLGGIRFVLLAIQTKRAFTCWRPIFGYDKWLTVTPSERCSNDSSITVLSKYHVTFGRGRPLCYTKSTPTTKNIENVRKEMKFDERTHLILYQIHKCIKNSFSINKIR